MGHGHWGAELVTGRQPQPCYKLSSPSVYVPLPVVPGQQIFRVRRRVPYTQTFHASFSGYQGTYRSYNFFVMVSWYSTKGWDRLSPKISRLYGQPESRAIVWLVTCRIQHINNFRQVVWCPLMGLGAQSWVSHVVGDIQYRFDEWDLVVVYYDLPNASSVHFWRGLVNFSRFFY